MIDVTNETLILPTEVNKVLPKQKKKTNVSTVYRWMQRGLRGYRLEYVCIGGTRFTSREALNRFFNRITEAESGLSTGPSKSTSTAAKQANKELDAFGF